MIQILTIEREYGCGGGQIAAKIADRLGWTLWDQSLTAEIARLSHCDECEVESREERVDPLYYRLLKSVLRGSFEGSLNTHRLELLDADTVFRTTKRVVEKAASAGNCVIVGRGAQHFLAERKDTLRVFLYASPEEKTRRLIAGGMNAKEAEEQVATVDDERAAFIRKYFKMDWPNRFLYHAMLNTSMGDETVIRSVLHLKMALDEKGPTVAGEE